MICQVVHTINAQGSVCFSRELWHLRMSFAVAVGVMKLCVPPSDLRCYFLTRRSLQCTITISNYLYSIYIYILCKVYYMK
jgi:hypothetical protein